MLPFPEPCVAVATIFDGYSFFCMMIKEKKNTRNQKGKIQRKGRRREMCTSFLIPFGSIDNCWLRYRQIYPLLQMTREEEQEVEGKSVGWKEEEKKRRTYLSFPPTLFDYCVLIAYLGRRCQQLQRLDKQQNNLPHVTMVVRGDLNEPPKNSSECYWGRVKEVQVEAERKWCWCGSMELLFGNHKLMALGGCTHGESMIFVLVRRGDARRWTQIQK